MCTNKYTKKYIYVSIYVICTYSNIYIKRIIKEKETINLGVGRHCRGLSEDSWKRLKGRKGGKKM